MSADTDEEDAIVLYAVLKAGATRSSASAIASYCDYVNHLRPPDEAVAESFERLSAFGWVTVVGSLAEATPLAVSRLNGTVKQGVPLVEGVMTILKAIQSGG